MAIATDTHMAMQKVMFTIPSELLTRLDEEARSAGASRSQVIRAAVQAFLEVQQTERRRQQLAEGYQIHAGRDLRVAEAFRYVDYETGLQPETPPEAVETESW